jgi:hypothetical protein
MWSGGKTFIKIPIYYSTMSPITTSLTSCTSCLTYFFFKLNKTKPCDINCYEQGTFLNRAYEYLHSTECPSVLLIRRTKDENDKMVTNIPEELIASIFKVQDGGGKFL